MTVLSLKALLNRKAHIIKSSMYLLSVETFQASLTNSVDPDQTRSLIWIHAVASILMLKIEKNKILKKYKENAQNKKISRIRKYTMETNGKIEHINKPTKC